MEGAGRCKHTPLRPQHRLLLDVLPNPPPIEDLRQLMILVTVA
jgi:hypothetical protein